MFKIEDLYVEDRRLGDLLKAIAGLARGMPRPIPVANIEEGGKGLKARSDGGNLLTFTGANFAGIAIVTFPDGSLATSVTIVNSTTVTAIAPAQTAGDIGGGTVTTSGTACGAGVPSAP